MHTSAAVSEFRVNFLPNQKYHTHTAEADSFCNNTKRDSIYHVFILCFVFNPNKWSEMYMNRMRHSHTHTHTQWEVKNRCNGCKCKGNAAAIVRAHAIKKHCTSQHANERKMKRASAKWQKYDEQALYTTYTKKCMLASALLIGVRCTWFFLFLCIRIWFTSHNLLLLSQLQFPIFWLLRRLNGAYMSRNTTVAD